MSDKNQDQRSDSFQGIEDSYLAEVYAKRPITLVKGEGVNVWDAHGNKYLDLVTGHGVAILGHSHPKFVEKIQEQISKMITCPGIFYNDKRAKLGEKIAEITPSNLDKTFLSNSGTESVEAAIKLARKATGKTEIIALKKGFHGRTLGALSVSWTRKYREPFKPLVSGVKHASAGDIEAIKENYTKDTAAIIVEPIQGEGGVIIHPKGYLRELREFCDEKEILLVFDEVQSGMGRTGKMFAFEHSKTHPDIMCLAKGLAGGIPIGATISSNEIFSHLKKGEHSSTFGGNPLACSGALATIDIIENEKLLENASKVGDYFMKELSQFLELPSVIDVRGMGLMIALQTKQRISDYVRSALDKGLLVLTSGLATMRILPPLILLKENVDETIDILKGILE
ncbi:MAG: aspartate aminotransferase family protein [Candidatus Ranarchaeia archaeon]